MTRAEFADRLAPLIGADRRLALAVSGGCDSTALLALAAALRGAPGFHDLELFAATVDHGLRPEAAAEAATVAALARRLGVPHTALRWNGGAAAPAGNLQAAAREARYALLAEWRARLGVRLLALAHTEDDVAETFLLRLARGSGVDGLAQMSGDAPEPARFDAAGLGLRRIRPLLGVSRDRLKATCAAHDAAWSDDPSNDDPRFARTQARAALAALAPLGLGAAQLAATAARMRRARGGLETAAAALAQECALGGVHDASGDGGLLFVGYDAARLAAAPEELRFRVLAGALRRVSGADYPPRFEALTRAAATLLAPAPNVRALTLHGCAALRQGGALFICREPGAVAARQALAPGEIALWDRRFIVRAGAAGAWVGALGVRGAATAGRRARSAPPDRAALWRAAPTPARRAAPGLWPLGGADAAPALAPALGEAADLGEIWPAAADFSGSEGAALVERRPPSLMF